jgi:hypothetical protein
MHTRDRFDCLTRFRAAFVEGHHCFDPRAEQATGR